MTRLGKFPVIEVVLNFEGSHVLPASTFKDGRVRSQERTVYVKPHRGEQRYYINFLSGKQEIQRHNDRWVWLHWTLSLSRVSPANLLRRTALPQPE